MTRSTNTCILAVNAHSHAQTASRTAPTNSVGHVATLATTATKPTKMENTMEQTTKQAVGTNLLPNPEPKRYSVMFSVEELKELEDLIYEKSSILDSMSEFQAYAKNAELAGKLSRKAIRIEKIAVRLGVILDRLHVENGVV